MIFAFSITGCSENPESESQVTPPRVEESAKTLPKPPGLSQAALREARAKRNREANQQAASSALDRATEFRRGFYEDVERKLLSSGRLRVDRGADALAPDVDSLTRNFVRIALRNEYDADGRKYPSGAGAAALLRKWTQPVRIETAFGDASDVAARRAIQGEVSTYAARLSKASGHSVSTTDDNGNFTLLVLAESERNDVGSYLRKFAPDIPEKDIAILSQLSPDIFCTVFAYSKGNSYSYARALAIIRAELPPLLRRSCIHEELAQGMGLANDDPSVRPSVFNDDEEYALLTHHDELLLKILYDHRLRPGMSEQEATPIVRKIAGELLAD